MKKLIILTLFIVFSASKAFATGYQQFDLQIPDSFITEEYKKDLKNWRLSLLKGVGYDEDNINEAVFLRTDIPLKVNGHESIGQIYQHKDKPNQYYVLASNTIVDFTNKQVGTMGVSGITNHPTPSGRMVIVLAPSKNINLLGVTLDFTFKVQVMPPKFTGTGVTYEWRAW